MKKLFKTYSQFGFTLVEIVATLGISAVIALVVAKVMESGQKDLKRIEARVEINTVHQAITNIMQDKANCSMTLRSLMPTDASPIPVSGIDVTTIKKCKTPVLEDTDGDNISEINCAASDLIDMYSKDTPMSNNSVEIDTITYLDDIARGGPRIEIVYNVLGATGNRTRASGMKQVRKEPILLTVSYNQSNIFSCEADISNILNATVAQSCNGNNAYLDKTQDSWKCYHETDLPECAAGSAIVAVLGSEVDQLQGDFSYWKLGDVFNGVTGVTNVDSKRLNPSKLYIDNVLTNNKAITFKCVDITPVNTACDDSDATTLDITVVTGAGTSVATDFFTSKCLHIPNCYDATTKNYLTGSFYHLVYDKTDVTIDDVTHNSFKCVQKKCQSGQISLTTNFGEYCISCPAGSVIVKTSISPGFKCSSTSCIDNSGAGTSSSASENVQQYFTGRWDTNGDPVCRDLITTDGRCTDGGSLKVASDGSVRFECCPTCDSSFNSEKAQVCYGQSFTASNGCTICEGTKDLQTGCPDPILYCPGTAMGTSDCGQACNPATKPVDQGTVSDWGNWSICENSFAPLTGGTMSTTTTRTRTCDGAECGGNCNGAALEETKDCEIFNPNGGSALTFAQCDSAGGVVVYVDQNTKGPCNNSSGMSSYLNSTNPTCVPLCFLPPANISLNGRAAGHDDSYNGNSCSYTEVNTDMATCPSGYTRYRNFATATAKTCSCCVVRDGCSGGNQSCNNVTAPGYNWEDKLRSQMNIVGYDKVLTTSGNGNSCKISSDEYFVCYPTIQYVGCYQ